MIKKTLCYQVLIKYITINIIFMLFDILFCFFYYVISLIKEADDKLIKNQWGYL